MDTGGTPYSFAGSGHVSGRYVRYTFRVLTLSRIVETWMPLLRRAAECRWLGDFADRYVRLELSGRGLVDVELVVQRGLLAERKRVT